MTFPVCNDDSPLEFAGFFPRFAKKKTDVVFWMFIVLSQAKVAFRSLCFSSPCLIEMVDLHHPCTRRRTQSSKFGGTYPLVN